MKEKLFSCINFFAKENAKPDAEEIKAQIATGY